MSKENLNDDSKQEQKPQEKHVPVELPKEVPRPSDSEKVKLNAEQREFSKAEPIWAKTHPDDE